MAAGRPRKQYTDDQIIEYATQYLNTPTEDKAAYLKSVGITQPTLWRRRKELEKQGLAQFKATFELV